jgi:hypothetical protein
LTRTDSIIDFFKSCIVKNISFADLLGGILPVPISEAITKTGNKKERGFMGS